MKRDMDLIRRILLAIQAKNHLRPERLNIDGEDEIVVARHVELLLDNGFVYEIKSPALNAGYTICPVKDLCWAGHDFLDSIKAPEVWEKPKRASKKPGHSRLNS